MEPSIKNLAEEFRRRAELAIPGHPIRLTLFGSRARGDAEPDSDLDLLVEIGQPHVTFDLKRRLRRIAGELSIEAGIVINLLVIDRETRTSRGDRTLFRTIDHEGVAV